MTDVTALKELLLLYGLESYIPMVRGPFYIRTNEHVMCSTKSYNTSILYKSRGCNR
jgi:hypothetical protein